MIEERVLRLEIGQDVFTGICRVAFVLVLLIGIALTFLMDHQAKLDRERTERLQDLIQKFQSPDSPQQNQSLPLPVPTRGAMRVYLSARFQRQEEMRRYAAQLRDQAVEVVSAWHDVDVPSVDGFAGLDNQRRAWLAMLDLQQLMGTNVVAAFATPDDSHSGRLDETGGRHVEFGVSLALGKRVLLIGDSENCYHSLPDVEHFPAWPAALDRILELRGGDAMTSRQAAKEASTTIQQIGMWIREGRLPAAKRNGRYVIARNDLDRAKAIHLRARADALAAINDDRLFPVRAGE